jgi:hypothetical protein
MEELEKEIEIEDLGESSIRIPFSPADIKMDTQTVNLGSVIEMLEFGEINLKPDFQRSADLWSPTQKCRLIESILLGIPLPSFYFNEDEHGKLEVIDGLQRLCALKDFIPTAKEKEDGKSNQKLRLSNLEFLDSRYNNILYDDLSREDKRRISMHKITLNIINKTTPKKVKYIIFKRVNSAGLQLTFQEMRHAINQGVPADFIAELANLEAFKIATDKKISSKRMEDRDFTNRFVAFYLPGNIKDLKNKYEGELDGFLNSALEELEKLPEDKIESIRSNFSKSMELSFAIFGNDAFRKRNHHKDPRKPISKSVFDTISVNLAWLSDEQREVLLERKELFINGLITLFNDKKFSFSISTGTAQKANVEKRFEEVYNLIKSILKNDNQLQD